MIPLSDNIRSRTIPYVNVAIILVCIALFVYEWVDRGFADRMAFKPAYLLSRELLSVGPTFAFQTLLVSIFLHGGLLHIASNMLALWVFGDNVEDRMGHMRYLIFYLFCGIVATLAHSLSAVFGLILNPMSLDRGLVGASGAIAGVMGAYFVLVPGASIRTLVVLFIFITILEIPSGFFIFLWFVLQLFAGLGSILGPGAAVAYWAHIGGFVTGYILARGMNRSRRRPLPRVIEMDVRDL